MSDLLDGLNEAQKAAVTHGEGPLMIIAGAGTGKTTVVTKRIAWLMEQKMAKPDEILALTFTEKAAREMEERVDRLLPLGYVDLWISTFHAFCERVLRAHALETGLPDGFRLVDDVDAYLLVRKHLDRFTLDYYKPRGNPTKFIQALLSHFSRAKDECITPERYLKFAEEQRMDQDALQAPEEVLSEQKRLEEVANAYHVYQQILLEEGCLDFADLIAYTIELFEKRPGILKRYQKQFKYVLVDEFQDTNTAQYELVKKLCSAESNITVVGDDDQSIYRFRGASLSNILRFRTDYPTAKSIVLNQNYRSTKAVLDRSYKLIQQNNPRRLEAQEKLDKRLLPQTDEEGLVEHIHCSTVQDEARTVLQTIVDIKAREKCNWSDFCILVRANDHAEPFLASLERNDIPYKFLALSGLYTKPIILDALAYLRVMDFPHESPSLYRVLSHPRLGITEADLAALTLYAKRRAVSLIEAVKSAALISELSPDTRTRLNELLILLTKLRNESARRPMTELFVLLMNETGLLADVRLQVEVIQQEDFGYLQAFYERIKKFEATHDDKTLHHFLGEFSHEREAGENGALETDLEEGPDVVHIMTVHGAKGLEFPYVFIVNLVEQRFPSQSRSEAIPLPDGLLSELPHEDFHVDEERRLFYVALTRAKKGAYLLSAASYGGTRARKISRFVSELEIEQKGKSFEEQLEQASKNTESEPTSYKTPSRLSFTQIAAFTTCPLQYKFAHILRVPTFGRHQFSFGQTMHGTLQKFLILLQAQQLKPQASLFEPTTPAPIIVPPLAKLLDIYEETWIDEWYPNDEEKKAYRQQGKESLMLFYERMKEHPPAIFDLERGFTLKLGNAVVKGRIDRMDKVDGGVEIIDYKTGRPKEKLSWEDKRQLILYQLAAERSFDPPLVVKKLGYYYLEDNSLACFEATEKDKERLIEEICETVEALKNSSFLPTPGFHCQYCDFKEICEFAQV